LVGSVPDRPGHRRRSVFTRQRVREADGECPKPGARRDIRPPDQREANSRLPTQMVASHTTPISRREGTPRRWVPPEATGFSRTKRPGNGAELQASRKDLAGQFRSRLVRGRSLERMRERALHADPRARPPNARTRLALPSGRARSRPRARESLWLHEERIVLRRIAFSLINLFRELFALIKSPTAQRTISGCFSNCEFEAGFMQCGSSASHRGSRMLRAIGEPMPRGTWIDFDETFLLISS
jgi:hypothetical protein